MFFFFQAEDGIRDSSVTGVQTCALPISTAPARFHITARFTRAWSGRSSPRRKRENGGSASASPVSLQLATLEIRVVIGLRDRQRIAGVAPDWSESCFPVRRARYWYTHD